MYSAENCIMNQKAKKEYGTGISYENKILQKIYVQTLKAINRELFGVPDNS